jgi:hypothetical protein
MKKKLNNKLVLRKTVISHLTAAEQAQLPGGIAPTTSAPSRDVACSFGTRCRICPIEFNNA